MKTKFKLDEPVRVNVRGCSKPGIVCAILNERNILMYGIRMEDGRRLRVLQSALGKVIAR
jgi:hypothetical protein